MPESFPRIAALKTAALFRDHLTRNSIPLDFDDQLLPPDQSPLAEVALKARAQLASRTTGSRSLP